MVLSLLILAALVIALSRNPTVHGVLTIAGRCVATALVVAAILYGVFG